MRYFPASILVLTFVAGAAFAASPTIPMFVQVDRNGDGSVTRAELAGAPGGYDLIFTRADHNNDGELSESEYTAAVSAGGGMQKGDVFTTD